MKELSQVACLFVDHGLFLPLALGLGRSYKRVLYHKPGTEAFPTLGKCCIGDGFELVEACADPWPLIDAGEIDVAVFPDLLDAGMQLHLEQLGLPVWGSRKGDSVELIREKFLRVLKENDLPQPKFERVVGVSALRDYLREKENVYIKISRYRGDFETSHWGDWSTDEGMLDVLAVRFGPCKEMVPFLVFEDIATDIEDGGDSWCIDGQWPSLVMRGIECKDQALLSAVTERAELPDYLREIMEVFSRVLAPYRYRNLFSMEVRVQDDKAFFIDPTCRGPMPGSNSHLMVWENFAEVIWAGAHGELVEPKPKAKFSAECLLTLESDDKSAWSVTEIPAALDGFMHLGDCCEVDGKIGFPPSELRKDTIGWLGAIGDTPGRVIEQLKEHVALLPEGVSAHIEALVKLVQEAEKMEEEGVPLTEESLPEPAAVVEE